MKKTNKIRRIIAQRISHRRGLKEAARRAYVRKLKLRQQVAWDNRVHYKVNRNLNLSAGKSLWKKALNFLNILKPTTQS